MPPRTPPNAPPAPARLPGHFAALAFLLFAATVWAAPDRLPNQACLDCHEAAPPDKKEKDAESNPAIEILRTGPFSKSVHGKLLCVDCHVSVTGIPHDDKLPKAQCASCHKE